MDAKIRIPELESKLEKLQINQDVPKEELKNLEEYKGFNPKIKKAVLMSLAAALGLQFGSLFYKNNIKAENTNQTTIEMNKPIENKILSITLNNKTTPNPELPKTNSPNPKWYDIENQPLEAIIKEIEKKDIKVYIGKTEAKINEQNYTLDAAPYIKNGRTLVPLRFIAEGLGAQVGWDGIERKVTLEFEGKIIELWIGKKQAKIDGINYELDVPAEITKGRTFVPIRFIAENFGSQVNWNSILKEVSITKEKEYKKINENSDADKDGLTFKEEKNLGTNPNDKNTIYNSLTDKELFELKNKYPTLNIFSAYPDGTTKLTLPEKISFGLNPVKAFSLDEKINDEIILKYALNNNPNTKTKEELEKIWKNFNEKYSSFIDALKENLSLETISSIDKVGDLILNFKNQKLDEKLKTEINTNYVKRVLEKIDEFQNIALIVASFSDDFVNANKDYFLEIKNTSLEFISEILTKYPELTIEKQTELNKKYPELDFSKKETFENPDKKSGLSLTEKIKYNINPLNPNNFDNILNDKKAIEYAKTKILSNTKENILKAVKTITETYGEKLGTATKQLTNEEKITPEEIDNQAEIAKKQIENMWNERANKTKTNNSIITLEELTSIPRYKTLILLNKTYSTEEINILLSQSPTLQNSENIKEFEDLINTLYNASNSTELLLNKKVKDTNNFKKYINQLGLYDYNAGELAVQMWQNANDTLKTEIKSHPKMFLGITAGFGPYVNTGEFEINGQKYNFQDREIFENMRNWSLNLLDYYIETEKIFKEKNVWLFKIGYNKGLEFYDFTLLQGLIPGTLANIDNGGFSKILETSGLKEALNHTFNITEQMKGIRDLIIEKYHGVSEEGYDIDWLDPIVGPAQISMKMNWLGLHRTGKKGIPYGVILKEGDGKNLTDLEASNMILKLLNPTNKEVFETNQYGLIQLETIVMRSIANPLFEGRYKVNKTTKGDSAALILVLDDKTKKKVGNFLGITNINIQKYYFIEKFKWEEIVSLTDAVYYMMAFRRDPTNINPTDIDKIAKDKSWVKRILTHPVGNPAIFDYFEIEKLFSVFKGANSF